jgi:hypothetical protein
MNRVTRRGIVVCIGTVGRPTFGRCYKQVMELKKRDPRIKKVVVIKDQPSQAAWLNKMIEESAGHEWCLQVDEDMYINPDAIIKLTSLVRRESASGARILNASGLLFDLFLKHNVGSLKIWNVKNLSRFRFNDVLGCDRDMARQGVAAGLSCVSFDEVLGSHDSSPTIAIGSEKYKTYIEKISKFDSLDKAERFIEDMHSKYGDSEIVMAMKRKFVKMANPKPCIVFHAHYENTFLKCVEYFKRINIETDIYITTSESFSEIFRSKNYLSVINSLKNVNCFLLDISVPQDKGVDISYFFESIDFLDEKYSCIIKLHTKSGEKKRHFGISNDEYMQKILDSFFKKHNFGYMCAKANKKYFAVKNFMHPYPNGKKESKKNIMFFDNILKEYDIKPPETKILFFAGSFLFADFELVRYLKRKKREFSFPKKYHFSEIKRPDGNIEHAFERFFAIACKESMLHVVEI